MARKKYTAEKIIQHLRTMEEGVCSFLTPRPAARAAVVLLVLAVLVLVSLLVADRENKGPPEPLAGGSGPFEPGNGLPGGGVWLLDWGFAWNAGDPRRISG